MQDSERNAANDVCLVLMFKAPDRSKRRLAGAGAVPADEVARCLLDCALEDLAAWPGPVAYAPADEAAAQWLRQRAVRPGRVIEQGPGNLGARIETVNRELAEQSEVPQIFLGIDCPALTPAYLADAARCLIDSDVVLGPATDGGVVLMGVAGRWPPLRGLPWSEATLGEALLAACESAGLRASTIAMLGDVDSVADLERARVDLADDPRPARRALVDLVASAAHPRDTAIR